MPNLEVYWSHQNNKRFTRSGDQLIVSGSDEAIPIINEIPRFSESGYARNFGDQWGIYNEDQFDNSENFYKDLTNSHDTLQEVFPVPLSELKNKSVLEAGGGNGRFAHVMLKNGARVDSFDLSHSVDAFKHNMKNRGMWNTDQTSLAQANILNMPYEKNSYDFVVCVHVLQHTPNPEESIKKLWEMVKPGGVLVIDHYLFKLKSLYPPIGGFGNFFRHITLMLPYKLQKPFSDNFVKFWFPIHWYFKNSRFIQQILLRISPVRFYYPWLNLPSKEAYYEKALCDTHDGSTDKYHHVRTVGQIRRCLLKLKEVGDCKVFKGGNGVLAWAYKR
jgi:2-polyprenyl-3-methyl-5-hydroxy-6-metoxy-1,4-benzoquinol methylase